MDAISFVLGTDVETLRLARVQDLINKGARKSECYVTLFLRTASNAEVALTRSVSSDGKVATAVDGAHVSEKDFAATLRKYGIGARISTFLVFQHAVESVAQLKAKELTELIEQVSGSGELRSEYNEKKKSMDTANEKLAAASIEKRGAIAEVNQLRLHKKEAEKYEEVTTRLIQERRDLALFELFHVESQLDKYKKELERFSSEAAALEGVVPSDDDIKKLKKALAEKHKVYLETLKKNREVRR